MHQRFEGRVKIDLSTGCWEWQLYVSKSGYGQMTYLNKQGVSAHRVSYELHVGPIRDGLTVDHICFNTICVNPDHLQLLTRVENIQRTPASLLPHCRHGHAYDEANTYINQRGRRSCRRCNLAAALRYKQRKQEAAA